jgi:hypothetical protein
LTNEELLTVDKWRKFYHEKYTFVGYVHELEGLSYYDQHGKPLPVLKTVQNRILVDELSAIGFPLTCGLML